MLKIRSYRGAREIGADVIVRITSDCPLIDPDVSDHAIREFLEKGPDYASNTLERTYPRGLDTEVIQFSALECAWREADKPYQRVHVTPYLYQNLGRCRLLSIKFRTDYSAGRWTLDTAEDLEFLQAVFLRFGGSSNFGWLEVVNLLEQEPTLSNINQHIRQKALHEG